MVFFDLALPYGPGNQKAKQSVVITPSDRQSLEEQIDSRVQLGYTVIAINHEVRGSFQSPVLSYDLRPREGVVILRRLTIVVDESNEKGFGLTAANTALLASYDIISILPMTQLAFSAACLTHSVPSALTSHIITLDLAAQPRLPYHLKHTLIRTAIRNGVVFEIPYAPVTSPLDEHRRRNWWANARDVCRVTNGKNVIFGSGTNALADLRAPLDVANLGTLLGLSQDAALNALTKTTKSLVLRAQTRKTYRSMLSEPKIVYPSEPAHDPLENVDTTVVAVNDSNPSIDTSYVPSKRNRDKGATTPDIIGAGASQGRQRKKQKKNKDGGVPREVKS